MSCSVSNRNGSLKNFGMFDMDLSAVLSRMLCVSSCRKGLCRWGKLTSVAIMAKAIKSTIKFDLVGGDFTASHFRSGYYIGIPGVPDPAVCSADLNLPSEGNAKSNPNIATMHNINKS